MVRHHGRFRCPPRPAGHHGNGVGAGTAIVNGASARRAQFCRRLYRAHL